MRQLLRFALGSLGQTAGLTTMAVLLHTLPLAATSIPPDAGTAEAFTVLTAKDGVTSATDLMIVEFRGAIESPMADGLRKVWDEARAAGRFRRIAVRLNSPGGSDEHGFQVISVLAEIRAEAHLTTIVGEGDLCASMCVALFIQGDERYASPASSWMFHGTSMRLSNVPDPDRTEAHFDLFRSRSIDGVFIDRLFDGGYVTRPGAYWLSGKELFEQSNIITRLLPNWRPATPRHQPMQVMQRSR